MMWSCTIRSCIIIIIRWRWNRWQTRKRTYTRRPRLRSSWQSRCLQAESRLLSHVIRSDRMWLDIVMVKNEEEKPGGSLLVPTWWRPVYHYHHYYHCVEYYFFVLRLKAVFLKLYFHWSSTFLLPLYLPLSLSSKAFRPKCPGPHLRAKVTQILPVIRSSWGQIFIIIVIIIIVIIIIINIAIAASNSPT